MAPPLTTRSTPPHPHAKWAGHSRTRFRPIPLLKGTWFRPVAAIPNSSSSVTANSLFHSLRSNKAISPFKHTSPVYTLENLTASMSSRRPLSTFTEGCGSDDASPRRGATARTDGGPPPSATPTGHVRGVTRRFSKGQRDIATTP